MKALCLSLIFLSLFSCRNKPENPLQVSIIYHNGDADTLTILTNEKELYLQDGNLDGFDYGRPNSFGFIPLRTIRQYVRSYKVIQK